MGFYAHYLLPRITDLAMRNRESARLRADWIARARGEVLEVGMGSGLNLSFYSSEVQRVYGVDPSVELQRMARQRAAGGSVPVEFLLQSAEEPVPLDPATIDTVVITWTLCSVPNAPRALERIKRVLKVGGSLIFLEHGRAPDPGVVAWQDRLTPLWKRIGGGCHLNRKIDELITAAGFQIPGHQGWRRHRFLCRRHALEELSWPCATTKASLLRLQSPSLPDCKRVPARSRF
jgi:ubiquinone/menaquinone biosynthesis C-methylase UbiE